MCGVKCELAIQPTGCGGVGGLLDVGGRDPGVALKAG